MPLKTILHEHLRNGAFQEIADLAAQRRRVLGGLISLTFDPDPLIGWRAVEAMGLAVNRIAEDDPEFALNHLRRLYWLICEESGGQCWRAPEAMAEAIVGGPDLFANYTPIVVSLLQTMAEEDLDRFRPGALWAIGRLGALAEECVEDVLPQITSALDRPDPQARGMAVWCLTQIGRSKLMSGRSVLLADEGPVQLYESGTLTEATVGELARRAMVEKT